MDSFLIVVPRIYPEELRELNKLFLDQCPGSSYAVGIYQLKEGPDGPFLSSSGSMDSGIIKGVGSVSSLIRQIKTNATFAGIFIWVPDISLILRSSYSLPEILRELEKTEEIAIGFRDSIPFIERIFGKILFPDLIDPVSDRFLVHSKKLECMNLDHVQGPVLPYILCQLNTGSIKEFPWKNPSGYFSSHKRLNFVQLLRIIGAIRRNVARENSLPQKEMKIFLKFGIVGLSGIVVNTGMLFFLTEYMHVFYLLSSACAIEVSIWSNFILNEKWTFSNRTCTLKSVRHRLLSYNILTVGGMAINMGTLFVLTEYSGLFYLYANLIGIFIAFAWNYLLNRTITWKEKGGFSFS